MCFLEIDRLMHAIVHGQGHLIFNFSRSFALLSVAHTLGDHLTLHFKAHMLLCFIKVNLMRENFIFYCNCDLLCPTVLKF